MKRETAKSVEARPKKRRRGPGRPVGWRKKGARRARLPAPTCTDAELRLANELARLYADGDLPRWMRYWVLNAPKRKLPPLKSETRGEGRGPQ